MTPVFADTSYFLAFLGEKDQYHMRAVAWTRVLQEQLVSLHVFTGAAAKP